MAKVDDPDRRARHAARTEPGATTDGRAADRATAAAADSSDDALDEFERRNFGAILTRALQLVDHATLTEPLIRPVPGDQEAYDRFLQAFRDRHDELEQNLRSAVNLLRSKIKELPGKAETTRALDDLKGRITGVEARSQEHGGALVKLGQQATAIETRVGAARVPIRRLGLAAAVVAVLGAGTLGYARMRSLRDQEVELRKQLEALDTSSHALLTGLQSLQDRTKQLQDDRDRLARNLLEACKQLEEVRAKVHLK